LSKRDSGRSALLLVAAVLVVAGAAAFSLLRGGPEITVVQPPDVGLLPQMQSHIEQYVARAEALPDDADRHGQLGIAYAANGLWSEARACFRNVMLLDPQHMLGRYHWILALQHIGEPDVAVSELKSFTRDFPDFAPGHQRLGVALLGSGDLDGAESSFRCFIELRSTLSLGFQGLGDVQFRRGDYAAAKGSLEKALAIDARSAQTRYLLGMTLRELGELDRVAELLQDAHSFQEYLTDPWTQQFANHSKDLGDMVRRAEQLAQAERLDESASMMQEALAWQPRNVSLLNNLAGVRRRLRQIPEARSLLERALEIDVERFETHMNLALVEGEEGKIAPALERIDHAIDLAPDVAYVRFCKGNLLQAAGRPSEARDAFRSALTIDRNFIEAHVGVATSSAAMNQWEAARAALEAARRINSQHPLVQQLAAQMAAQDGGGG